MAAFALISSFRHIVSQLMKFVEIALPASLNQMNALCFSLLSRKSRFSKQYEKNDRKGLVKTFGRQLCSFSNSFFSGTRVSQFRSVDFNFLDLNISIMTQMAENCEVVC